MGDGPSRFADGCRWGRSAPVGRGDLPTCRLPGTGKGAMPRPFTIPGLAGMPAAGKAPSYGSLFTGRSPHAIPGVALPLAVLLTAHRFRSPLRPARQTARTFVNHAKAMACPHGSGRLALSASEAQRLPSGNAARAVPSCVGWGDLPTRRLAGAGKGAMPRPFTIPGLGGMPAAGKAPACGALFTGRSPHAIPGVALPFVVLLTAHRFRSPLRPARQTARTLVNHAKGNSLPTWLW